jgi:hypothetical protein
MKHSKIKIPQFYMKILSGDFSAKVDREHILKLTTDNETLHHIAMIMQLVQ